MKKNVLVLSLAAAVLAACGGGGGGDEPAPAPAPAPAPVVPSNAAEGIWNGKTSANRDISGIVLNDGTYYVMYSAPANPSVLDGVIQGTGTVNGSSFSSTNGRDFNLSGASVQGLSVSASVQAKQSLNGTLSYNATSGGTPLTFTSTYSADYEKTPTLGDITGRYSGQSAIIGAVENQTINVAADGAIAAIGSSGCASTGKATPRARGNAFDVSITFGASPCAFPGQTFTGIAYLDPTTKRLYAASLNGARSQIAVFLGTKQ
ncbi:hypothetical protein [Cupriavidus sp. a3]|uniref:hypothetical protein n=1 Tax=Cupriavidus sp. a3 TaxID=3242158 RepID=UPI003D9C06B8